MKKVQRWDAPRGATISENNDSGEFVFYDEHSLVVSDLLVKIANLRYGMEQIAGIWENGQDAKESVREAMDIAHSMLGITGGQ